MQVNVKRSFLLLLYRNFSEVFPDLNRIYLTMKPYDYILMAKLISSVFSKRIVFNIQNDEQDVVNTLYQSGNVDKDVLFYVLSSMEEQATLDENGMVDFELPNGLELLHVLEALLCKNEVQTTNKYYQESVIFEKLFLIEKKLGYTHAEEKFLHENSSSVKSGDILNVSDNSGAKSVKVIIEIEPSVYLVSVEKTALGHQNTFPYDTKYAAVLTSKIYPSHHTPNDVCLFQYHHGIGKPLFTVIAKSKDVLLTDLPNYKAIMDSSFFKFSS
jgi:hypothetical protein